jgi:fibronectin type 3 domain-containing protein
LLLFFSAITAHAQSSHTVALNWTQSPASGVTANKVYRSTTSGAQGTAIFTSSSPIVTYTDVGPLTNGTTYYYCVTALVGTNNESACSNQVSAVMPTPPAAPTALTDTVN